MAQQKNKKDKMDSAKIKSAIKPVSKVVRISELDQRKIYNWGNGQRSTPTGRQAADRAAKYARVSGDSAFVVPKPFKRD